MYALCCVLCHIFIRIFTNNARTKIVMPKQPRRRKRNRPTLADAAGGGGGGGRTLTNRRPFHFYILTTADLRCTYGGVSTDVTRRVQEHNGVIGNDKEGSDHTRMRRAQGHGLW